MVNMEMAAKESYDQVAPMESDSKYPYGLKICLDDESLSKLGMQSLPKVGSSMMLLAKVEICCVRNYETMAGGSDNSVELQITDMEIRPLEKKSAQDALYGGE